MPVDGQVPQGKTLFLQQNFLTNLPQLCDFFHTAFDQLRGLGPDIPSPHLQETEILFRADLAHELPDGLGRRLKPTVVDANQLRHSFQCVRIEPQAGQDLPGNLLADFAVPVEVAHTVLVLLIAVGFTQVVEEKGQPHSNILRGGCLYRTDGMLPYVIGVVGVVLGKSKTGTDFRDDPNQDVLVLTQDHAGVLAPEQFNQFLLLSLPGNLSKKIRLTPCRVPGVIFKSKTRHSGKPKSPHDSQPILAEPAVRTANTTNNLVFDILSAIEWVNKAGRGGVGHGVHREIAPGQVALE